MQSNSIAQAFVAQKMQSSQASGVNKDQKSRNPGGGTSNLLMGSKTHADKVQFMTVDNRENYRVAAQMAV